MDGSRAIPKFSKVLYEPAGDFDRGADAIRQFTPPVSFVGEQNILHWNAALLQASYNLLGFDDWHVRIIGAMQYDCTAFT